MADKNTPASTKTEQEIIDDLEREHGEVVVINVPSHGRVAFRAPTDGEYQRFIDKLSNNKTSNASAMRELCIACRVHPDRDAFRVILDRKPALARVAADAIDDLAGGSLEVEAKK